MMHRIQRIGVMQMAKVTGVLYLLFGLVFAAVMYLFSFARSGAEGAMFPGFGAGMVILMPVLYAFFGFVFGALSAWLYNVVAGPLGGIEIELVATMPSETP